MRDSRPFRWDTAAEDVGARLRVLLRTVCHDPDHPDGPGVALRQDLLDVAAVAAGMKPAALAGVGYEVDAQAPGLADALAGLGLVVTVRYPWIPACDADGLPVWYAAALERRYMAVTVVAVAQHDRVLANLPAPGEPVDAVGEATLLGYPPCCATAYHHRRRRYHHLMLGMLERQADGDEARMARLFGAGALPTPRSAQEAASLRDLVVPDFAPFTSIAMCAGCTDHDESPARRLAAGYARIARDTGFDPCAAPDRGDKIPDSRPTPRNVTE